MTTATDLLRVALFGSPPSNTFTPSREGVLDAFSTLEAELGAISLAGGVGVVQDTRAHLNADLAHAANTLALVYGDATDANNDYYVKVGASGTGSWTLTTIFHNSVALRVQPTIDQATALTAASALMLRNQRLRAPRALVIGASHVQQNHFASVAAMSTANIGEIIWAQAKYPYFTFDTWRNLSLTPNLQGMNNGVAGEIPSVTLTRTLAAMSRSPDFIIFRDGGNSVTAEVPAATQFADIQSMVKIALATGKPVILANITPRDSTSWPTGNKTTIWAALNTLIHDYATSGVPNLIFWDVASVFDDGTGRPKAGYLSDGTHDNRYGAKMAGDSLVPILKRIIKPVYDIRPQGTNIITNAALTGTTGALADGATGTAPTSWTVDRGIGTSGVLGFRTSDNYQGVQITPIGGSGAADESFSVYRTGNDVTVPGTWVQGYARFSLSEWAGWHETEMLFNFGGGTSESLTALGVHAASVVTPILNGTEQFLAVTPPHLVLAGNTAVNAVFRCFFDGRVTGVGAAIIQEVGLMTIDDPHTAYNL